MSPPSHFNEDEATERVNVASDIRSMSDTQAFKLMKDVEKDLENKIVHDESRGISHNDRTWSKFMLALMKGALEDKETYKENAQLVVDVRDEFAQFKRNVYTVVYIAGFALLFVGWFCIQQLTFLRDLNESKLQRMIDDRADARMEEKLRRVLREETPTIIKKEINSPEHIEKMKEAARERRGRQSQFAGQPAAAWIDVPDMPDVWELKDVWQQEPYTVPAGSIHDHEVIAIGTWPAVPLQRNAK